MKNLYLFYQRFLKICLLIIIFSTLFKLTMIAQKRNPVIINGNARFSVITPGLIRMEYSKSENFIDEPSLFAVDRNHLLMDFEFNEKNNYFIIKTSEFTLEYKPNGKIFSDENLSVTFKQRDESITWRPGMKNNRNLGGTIRTLDEVSKKLPLEDGLLSREGWYLLDDSKTPLFYNKWVTSRPTNSGTDWYLFIYGTNFKSALKNLTTIAGKIPLPRKYVFGSWYSRYWPYSSDDYRQIVKEYDENDFPLDIMVLDMDWHKDGWTGWSWNRKLLPDAEKLLEWLHSQGLYITLNVHPADGIKPHEDMYEEFMKEMGIDLSKYSKDKLPSLPYDASNKTYLDKLFKHTHEPLEKEGVDFWWLDWQQFQNTIGNPELKNLPLLNKYYFEYSERNTLRGQSFSRWGGWGDHKYPIHFSGDAVSIWPMLEFEIPFTSTAGNIGCFFWSHDIGGHMGGLNPETNARWVQFGSMTAALRLHSTRDKNMDKRPWLYEKMYSRSNQIAFHLRSILFPYLYSSAAKSCLESIPFTKPMYIEYPEMEIAYNTPQQFLLGDALLVAPISSAGTGKNKVASQNVWFPNGVWYNFFTSEKYVGESEANIWADIFEFPLFVKGGFPIPLQKFTKRMATEPLKELIIRTYPGEEGKSYSFILYEDDGITQEYKNGKFAKTRISASNDGKTTIIIVHPAEGEYKGQLKTRSYRFEFPATQKVTSAILNNKIFPTLYDEEMQMNIVEFPETGISESIRLEIDLKETDNNLVTTNSFVKRKEGLINEKSLDILNNENILQLYDESSDDFVNVLAFLSGIKIITDENNNASILKNSNSPSDDLINILVQDIYGNEITTIFSEEKILKQGENYRLLLDKELKEITGLESARLVSVTLKLNGRKYLLKRMIDKKESYLKNWNIVGTFDYVASENISEFKYQPEIQKKITLKEKYTDKFENETGWQKAICDTNNIFNLRKYYDFDGFIAYAYTEIESPKEQDITMEINSDDGVEAWINNKKIHSNNIFRAVLSKPDIVKTRLTKGLNTILLKISQGNGGAGFRVKVNTEFPIKN